MKALLIGLLFLTTAELKGEDTLSCTGKSDKSQLKHGTWICRNASGKIIRSERYKHGVMMNYILYNDKGRIIETRDKKGKVRKYNPCGC
jgi:hypothetical protein